MSTIFIRTLIIYVFLVAVMRFGGKRQVGELQVSELVTALLISEIASIPIGHDDIPLSFAVIPILTVICLEVIFSFVTTKSGKVRDLLEGEPSVLIRKGQVRREELGELHMTVDDLVAEARLKGFGDISGIEYAILEDNGKLSVFPKAAEGEKETGIAHVIVSDGEANAFGMTCAGMSEEELHRRLKKKRTSIEKVFLYTVNDAGEENWIFL